MGFKVCTIASGSSGNCTYISTAEATVLIDEGAPVRRVEKCLRLLGRGKHLAVAVTHAHSDHISGVAAFAEQSGAAVYVQSKSAAALKEKGGLNFARLVEFGDEPFFVGDIFVEPFAVSHDVPCVGYTLSHGSGKVGIATDIGHMSGAVLARLSECNLVIIESNHDVGMLRASKKYSPWLKQRILSGSGHLSNDDCAESCVRLAAAGVKQFVLAHLSEENNYPELAEQTVTAALEAAGFEGIGVEVAQRYKMSSLYEIV